MHGRALSVMAEGIEVCPFTGEIHSTTDYNGIAVVGVCGHHDIKLTVDTISTVINQIASELQAESMTEGVSDGNQSAYHDQTIHFIPLL